MTTKELQKTAKDGQEFFVFSAKGTKYKAKWTDVRAGLFMVLECEGRAVKNQPLCGIAGAPRAEAQAI